MTKEINWNAVPAYGAHGFVVPPTMNNGGIQPTPGREHQWACVATYRVSQRQADVAAQAWMNDQDPPGITLDHENLVNVAGPGCLKCNEPMTPTTYATMCPVQVIPLFARR